MITFLIASILALLPVSSYGATDGFEEEIRAHTITSRLISRFDLEDKLADKEYICHCLGGLWIVVVRDNDSYIAFNGFIFNDSYKTTFIPFTYYGIDSLFLYNGGLDITKKKDFYTPVYDCFATYSKDHELLSVWDNYMEKPEPPDKYLLALWRIMDSDFFGRFGWDNKDISSINQTLQLPIHNPEGDALKLELTIPEGYEPLIQTDSGNSFVTYSFQYPNNKRASEIYVIIKSHGINKDISSSELYRNTILNSSSGYSKSKLYWREIEYQGYFVGYKNVSFRERHRFKKALSTIKIEYE